MVRKAIMEASFIALEDLQGIQLSEKGMPVHRHVARNNWCESAVLNSLKISKSVM